MKDSRNSTCSLTLPNFLRLKKPPVPFVQIRPSVTFAGFPPARISSPLFPSQRTTAPSGGLAPIVGLDRTTRFRRTSPPGPFAESVPSAISPDQSLPLIAVRPPSVFADALTRVFL